MEGAAEDIGSSDVLTFEAEIEGVKIVEKESTLSSIPPKKDVSCIDGF